MSVINKMLSDLDKNKPQEEIKEEVAFLEPKSEPKSPKPQRSKKWWVAIISSGVSGVLAVVVAYLYYNHLQQTVDVLDKVNPPAKPPVNQQVVQSETESSPQVASTSDNEQLAQSQAEKSQPELTKEQTQSATSNLANKADAPANQPKLVVLTNKDENGKPIERKSTLSVQQKPISNPSSQVQISSDDQTVVDNLSAQIPEPTVVEVEQNTDNSPTGLVDTDESQQGQMSISKVSMSNEQRAQKHADQGQKLAQQGMIQPAIEKYQQALSIFPAHLQGRLALAGLYYGRNMVAEALEVLSEGLNIEPGNQDWSLLAAKIHYSRDNYAAALAYLQLPVHPVDNLEYVALKATTLQKLKDYQGAMRTFGELTLAYPESARWWLGLATSLEGAQKYSQAVDAYRQTLRLGSISQTSRRFVLSRLAQLER